MFGLGLALGFAGGGAAVWFAKDQLIKWWSGADAFAKALEAKAAAVKAAL
jgi:hypothetical protein